MANAVESMIRKIATNAILKVKDYNQGRMKTDKPNPFLHGVHAPLREEMTLCDLTVTGNIPPELNGSYIRIGPNPITQNNEAAHHWFVGDGMVHGVRLQDGKAQWYRNRWIRTEGVSKKLGEPIMPGTRKGTATTVNTNIVGHAGATYALVEATAYPVRIDGQLNSIAHDPFGGTLKGSFTAHPHLDPESGELHAICYEGTDPENIRHIIVDAQGKVRKEEAIQVKDGPSIHDCMITKNYVIIMDLPVTFSMKTLLAGHDFPYAWNPDHRPRVGLLPKEGGNDDVIWCDVGPCYIFHPCNAFENDDGNIIFDACVHDSMFAHSTQGPDSDRSPFERWTINPAARTVIRNIVDADSQEFPRINEQYIAKPYRYAYAMALPEGFDAASPNQSKLYKHDLKTGKRQIHDFGKGRLTGEFTFVPRAGAAAGVQAEDHGWLMGYIVNIADNSSDFVILDAANFEGEAVASIHIDHRIPPGFHGNWIAAQAQ